MHIGIRVSGKQRVTLTPSSPSLLAASVGSAFAGDRIRAELGFNGRRPAAVVKPTQVFPYRSTPCPRPTPGPWLGSADAFAQRITGSSIGSAGKYGPLIVETIGIDEASGIARSK